ncbi:MAG: carboxylating nicotinate-nucleotide diphosphorylase [Verrucomicrobiota bacterium]
MSQLPTLIDLALQEDLADIGDVTTEFFISPDDQSRGVINTREDAVLSGMDIAAAVFEKVDPHLAVNILKQDGSEVTAGDPVMTIEGSTRSILTGERTALNFMQRLSGVASVAREFSKRVSHTKAQILDTRKTTPGWRLIEKEAVVHGGGTNHRIGLYDAVMVKDNHLVSESSSESLRESIQQLALKHPGIKIEFEADRLDQVETFLGISEIDVILLDNMSNEQLMQAVSLRDKRREGCLLEASGGVNLETVTEIAETGVDYISVGALTHSVRSVDLGLDLIRLEA